MPSSSRLTCSLRISATLRAMLISRLRWAPIVRVNCQPCAGNSETDSSVSELNLFAHPEPSHSMSCAAAYAPQHTSLAGGGAWLALRRGTARVGDNMYRLEC